MIGDVFTAYFSYCQFNETIFPPLGGEKIVSKKRIVLVKQLVLEERGELA